MTPETRTTKSTWLLNICTQGTVLRRIGVSNATWVSLQPHLQVSATVVNPAVQVNSSRFKSSKLPIWTQTWIQRRRVPAIIRQTCTRHWSLQGSTLRVQSSVPSTWQLIAVCLERQPHQGRLLIHKDSRSKWWKKVRRSRQAWCRNCKARWRTTLGAEVETKKTKTPRAFHLLNSRKEQQVRPSLKDFTRWWSMERH